MVLPFLCHKERFLLQEYQNKNFIKITVWLTLAWHCTGGWRRCGSREAIGAILPTPTKATFLTAILCNSENIIRHIRPFCRPFFCHSSVVKYTSNLLQSKHVMRLEYQILLKSPPPQVYWLDRPLGWSSLLLILLWLFMVCEIAHIGYNSATVCILIHRQLSATIWKSSPNSSYAYDQNHCIPSFLDVIRISQGWIWSQIALLGNRFRASDASSVQQICKQKLTCEMTKKTKARSEKVRGLQ